MADHILYPPRAKNKQKAPVWLWVVIWVLVAIIVMQLVFNYYIAPGFKITRIDVKGDVVIDQGDFIRLTGVGYGAFYYAVDESYIAERLMSIPEVESVDVVKVFPDSLQVRMKKRQPAASLLVPVGSVLLPALADGNGIIYSIGDFPSEGMPVISGLDLASESILPGYSFSDGVRHILDDLAELKREAPVLYSGISEIKIEQRNSGAMEMVVYPVGYQVPVRIADTITAAQCKSIIMVLDVLEKGEILSTIEELDFRTGEIVYRLRRPHGS